MEAGRPGFLKSLHTGEQTHTHDFSTFRKNPDPISETYNSWNTYSLIKIKYLLEFSCLAPKLQRRQWMDDKGIAFFLARRHGREREA